jgi:hypothetical protein
MLVLCIGGAAFASSAISPINGVSIQDIIDQKDAAVTTGTPNPALMVGGENIATAAPIPFLPYSDGGTTVGYLNDYDEVCPFSGSTSPDVVYSYSPGAGITGIDVSLCDSGYDTKVYVYENAAGNLVGCNDDACGSDGFRSELIGVPVSAGNTYYIVVDGYGGASGTYDLFVQENVPCIVDCPPGGLLEGEVDCFEGYNDIYNSGCNGPVPYPFTAIPCDPSGAVTVCGTYGGFFHPQSGFNYRDTDWYTIDASANTTGFTWCVTGEYETLSGYLDPVCPAVAFVEGLVHGACVTQCYNIPAGNWYLFVATSGFGPLDFPCGADYVMTLDGYTCPPVSVENANWSKIKADYR